MQHGSYIVKIVDHQEMEFKDPNPPRGGFGLAEDDIIYRTVHQAIDEKEDQYPISDELED